MLSGVSQFTLIDLIIINRVLRIDLSKLIPTFLNEETKDSIKKSIIQLNKPKLKLMDEDFVKIDETVND